MDVTKKKKFGLEKKMSFLLYDKIFLGSSIWGPLRVAFCSEIENIIWYSILYKYSRFVQW